MKIKRLNIKTDHKMYIAVLYTSSFSRFKKSNNYPLYNINGWYKYGSHSWIEYNGDVYTSHTLCDEFNSHLRLLNHIPLSFKEFIHIKQLIESDIYNREEFSSLNSLINLDIKFLQEFYKSMHAVRLSMINGHEHYQKY